VQAWISVGQAQPALHDESRDSRAAGALPRVAARLNPRSPQRVEAQALWNHARLARGGGGGAPVGAAAHAPRAALQAALLRNGGANIAIVGVPWQLEAPAPARAIAEEEPATA
jgi:hypothetical protein